MDKHEQARKDVKITEIFELKYFCEERRQRLFNFINEAEATEKELEQEKKQHRYDINYLNEVIKGITSELEKEKNNNKLLLQTNRIQIDRNNDLEKRLQQLEQDVKKYFDLQEKEMYKLTTYQEHMEFNELECKLIKVGNDNG